MTWFKVDDDLSFHRKVVKAGNAAMGLWVRAGSWSAQQLTDGFVPDNMIELLGTSAQRRKLVSAELWEEVSGGVVFHGWSKNGRQPTAQSVREKRADAAKRQQEYRDRKAGKFSASSQVTDARNGATHTSVTESVTVSVTPSVTPAPTRPDPYITNSPTAAAAGAPDQRFLEFWDNYPRKIDKRAAERAWKAAVKRGVDPTHMITAAGAYALRCRGTEPRFIKHPSTWLNAGSYDDTPDTTNGIPADYRGAVMER